MNKIKDAKSERNEWKFLKSDHLFNGGFHKLEPNVIKKWSSHNISNDKMILTMMKINPAGDFDQIVMQSLSGKYLFLTFLFKKERKWRKNSLHEFTMMISLSIVTFPFRFSLKTHSFQLYRISSWCDRNILSLNQMSHIYSTPGAVISFFGPN